MTIYLPLLVALIGLLMYAFCVNPKLAEVGRVSYFAGLLAFLLTGLGPLVSVVGKHGG